MFFLALALLGWFLYPRDLFLGFIYEGFTELRQSEKHYIGFLEKSPYNKFATLRLAHLYDRLGEPQKATLLLKNLYEHRKSDWDMATRYLDHLENRNDAETLQEARLSIAHYFMMQPRFPRRKVSEMLYDTYLHARWTQNNDEAYAILLDLMKASKDPAPYAEEMLNLHRGLQKRDELKKALLEKVAANPKNIEAKIVLAEVYMSTEEWGKALQVIKEALLLSPNSVNLREMKIYVHLKRGEKREAIRDTEQLLSVKGLSKEERIGQTDTLAFLYSESGQKEKALSLYRQILKEDPETPERWINLAATLTDLKRYSEAIALLKKYETQFGPDFEEQKMLASIYLYEQKNVFVLPFYKKYVADYRQEKFASEVGYLLLDNLKIAEAIDWLEYARALFGDSPVILDPLTDAYIRDKQYDKALYYALKFLEQRPKDYEMTEKTALIYGSLQKPSEAKKYHEKMAALRPGNFETLKWVGRESLFSGLYGESVNYLEEANHLRPDDPEIWFLLSEAEYARGQKKKGKQNARKVVSLLETKSPLNENEERFLLKSRGRIGWNEALDKDYQMAVQEHPGNLALKADYADLLTQHREWKKAVPVLEALSKADPHERVYHRSLGDAYVHSGRWKSGMKEYELAGAKEPLRLLHKTHDHRVKALFALTDYGSEEYMEYGSAYQGYFSEPLEFKGEFWFGQFTSPAAGFDGEAEYGKALLASHHLQNWVFDAGLGFGMSDERVTVSPLASAVYSIPDLLSLAAGYQYRQLRTDLPQAVAAGDLIDTARFKGQVSPWSRLNIGVLYEFVRDYLPTGQKAYEHQLEPTVHFVITQKPYFTIGYQYTFIQVFDKNNFLAVVPLIRKMRANYGTGYLSWQIVRDFLFEAGGFIGDDTARDLEFVKGELWGAKAGISWNITPWCDLDVSYDYGREFLFDVPGRYQHVAVGLSGHWF